MLDAVTSGEQRGSHPYRSVTGATAVRPIIVFQAAVRSEWMAVGASRVSRRTCPLDACRRVVIDQMPGQIFG